MIVVDSSAIVAILGGEPLAASLRTALSTAEERLMSASTAVELGIVIESRTGGSVSLERLLRDFHLRIVSVDEQQLTAAMTAWRRFGKGRHPAALNYGDCFSYALASVLGLPLLYSGEDFGKTDVRSALGGR